MNRPFSTQPAKPAFGTFHNNNGSAGDYIINKKSKNILCNIDLKNQYKNMKFGSQNDFINAYKQNILDICQGSSFNKSNLNINLITKLNLENICVIKNNNTNKCPTTINLCSIPYLTYTIDPNGLLFGNSYCGANNYLNYLQYELPKSNM